MRAVQLTQTGEPDVLGTVEAPDPVPGPGEVLLEMRAAGVTFADTLMRAGAFPQPLDLPAVLGREVTGTVVGHGPDTAAPPSGTRVTAMVSDGGYAERVVVPADAVVELPNEVGDAAALGVLGSGLTAQGILDAGRVTSGERVLVTAAAGGVGSLAVQLAVLRGARVVGLASTQAKRDLVLELGGSAAADSTAEDWVTRALAAADGGVDVVLDSVAGPVLRAGPQLLAPHGRHVLYGAASGDLAGLDGRQLGALIGGNVSLIGFDLGGFLTAGSSVAERLAVLVSLLAEGSMRVPATDGFHLEDAAAAHRALAERRTSGKVYLTP